MNNLSTFTETAITFVATYFIHSTVLLASCWLILKALRPTSHYLAERMWKLAAVLGIVTAACQLVIIPAEPSDEASLQTPVEPVVEAPVEVYVYDDSSVESSHTFDLNSNAEQRDTPIISAPALANSNVDFVSGLPLEASTYKEVEVAESVTTQSIDVPTEVFVATDPTTAAVETSVESPLIDEETHATQLATTLAEWLPIAIRVASIVMLCGGVVGGLLLLVQATRWRLRFGRVQALSDGAAFDALHRFCRRHKIRRRVRLLASNNHSEPFAYGLVRWTIVLPEGVEERLDRNELKALIAHEMAHLVRGDVWWLWIGRLLCTCCAFQPLNFLARRRWQQAAEFLCDDWAVERGVRSLALARCLTRVAEWRFGIESHEVGLAAGGSKATLVGRVQRLVDEQSTKDVWKTPLRRRALTMGAAVAVVALVGFMPRVALPLTRVSECVAEVTSISIAPAPAVEQSATSDWHALSEELQQLDADLARVNELLTSRLPSNLTNEAAVKEYIDNLNRQASQLRSRREQITSLIEKESER